MSVIKELLEIGLEKLSYVLEHYSDEEILIIPNGAYVYKMELSEESINEINNLIATIKSGAVKRTGEIFLAGVKVKYNIMIKQKLGLPEFRIKLDFPLMTFRHQFSYINFKGRVINIRLAGSERYTIELLLDVLNRVRLFTFVFNMKPIPTIPAVGLLTSEENRRKLLAAFDLFKQAGLINFVKENKNKLVSMICDLLKIQ